MQLSVGDVTGFFGCPVSQVIDITAQYDTYTAEWQTLTDAERAIPQGAFWAKRRAKYPVLAPLGEWYAELPTSSAATERAFGIMRTMESTYPMSMDEDAFQDELYFKANSWLVDEALAASLTNAKALKLC
jgi:hypothetical protein